MNESCPHPRLPRLRAVIVGISVPGDRPACRPDTAPVVTPPESAMARDLAFAQQPSMTPASSSHFPSRAGPNHRQRRAETRDDGFRCRGRHQQRCEPVDHFAVDRPGCAGRQEFGPQPAVVTGKAALGGQGVEGTSTEVNQCPTTRPHPTAASRLPSDGLPRTAPPRSPGSWKRLPTGFGGAMYTTGAGHLDLPGRPREGQRGPWKRRGWSKSPAGYQVVTFR